MVAFRKIIYMCMLHIGIGSNIYISFSLPPNPVPFIMHVYILHYACKFTNKILFEPKSICELSMFGGGVVDS